MPLPQPKPIIAGKNLFRVGEILDRKDGRVRIVQAKALADAWRYDVEYVLPPIGPKPSRWARLANWVLRRG